MKIYSSFFIFIEYIEWLDYIQEKEKAEGQLSDLN